MRSDPGQQCRLRQGPQSVPQSRLASERETAIAGRTSQRGALLVSTNILLICVCLSRQGGYRGTLRVMIEGLSELAAVFGAPHSPHKIMEGPNGVVPQGVSLPGIMRALFHRSDIDVMGWKEVLRL